ncbi:MAG: DUF748 domain-containing protein [Thermodesulfobacteriota bacterium]
MKKLIKVIGILAVILVVAVVGLLVAAKILITPERVRQVVIPLAEKQLDRPVSIGDIQVRLFSGIVLSDFRIGEKDDSEDFVSAESLVLRYQLWPLIRRAVIVDELKLISPRIRIERYENGKFNFSDLLDKGKSDEDEARTSSEAPGEGAEADGGMPIDLLVNEISISGGRLVFIDQLVDQEYLLSELMVSVTDLSPVRPFPFDVSAKVNNAPVSVSGTINPAAQGITADVRIKELDVFPFMVYAPEDFPGKLSSMKLGVDIRADATADSVASDGQISVTELDFLPDDMPDAHVENGRFYLDYDVNVDLASEDIAIAKADADINGILLALSGSVSSYGQSPVLDVRARLPMTSLPDIVGAVPPKLAAQILEMRPEGRIGAEVHLKGSPENPESLVEKGDITLENVSVAIKEQTPPVSGGLRIAKSSDGAGDPIKYLFDMSAQVNSDPINIDGTITPGTRRVTASVQTENLDVSPFMVYAPEDFPGKLSSMKLGVDIRADATADRVASDGRISVTEIDFLPDDMPDAHVENGRFHLDYDVNVNLASENIAIAKADADVNGILLALSGSVASYSQSPVLDVRARLPMISLSDIVGAVPPKLAAPIREMRPEGRIGAELHLKGSPENPESIVENGDITLENVSVAIKDLTPKISGGIRLENDTAASDNLVIQAAGEPLQLRFTANRLMGETKSIRHTLTAERLDIDKLLAAMGAGEDGRSPDPPTDGAPKSPEPGPYDLPLDVEGDVRVANAVFKGLAVDNFDLQYQLKENVFTVNHVRGNVAGGTLSGKAEARLDRTPLAYTADISVQDSRAEHLLNALFPAASNTVYGNFFLNADISGEGVSWRNISRSLTSTADVNITNGRLTGTGLAGGLAGFLGAQRLEVINFDSLKGDVQLKEGQFKLDSRLTSDEVRMAPAGMIGLDGSLDLSLDMRLSQALASKIGGRDLVSALSRTGDGWTLVPVKVAGTLWSPKFEIDAAAVSDQLKERGREEIRQQLQDRVLDRLAPKDREKTDGQTGKEEIKPLEEELEDTMRKLFN